MGGMTCSICKHEAKEAIDQAIVAGGSRRTIANQYGLSDAAVGRHRENHLPVMLVKAAEAQELAHGERLLDRVEGLVDEALGSLKRSKELGREKDVLGAIREGRNCLELVGRVTGELKESKDSGPQTAFNMILAFGRDFGIDELRELAGYPTSTPQPEAVNVEGRVVESK